MNLLQSIINERHADSRLAERKTPVGELQTLVASRKHHSLVKRLLECPGTRIVAEVKKASPSAGMLREDYDPAAIARLYEKAGAVGISVLTEPKHFLGSDQHLRDVRAAVDLPILRKDFISDVYQIHETAAIGADVVLLIVGALDRNHLRELYEESLKCGLEVLAEAHTAEELGEALKLDNAIIGVNSRDLKTLKTDLAVARKLAPVIPSGRVSIAESGIKTRFDVMDLEKCGFSGFLVGEALMSGADPGSILRGLME